MILSISEAARLARRDRKTIQRAVAAGRLSLSHSATGGRGIEISELERVFGPLSHPSHAPVAEALTQVDASKDAAHVAALEAENSALKATIAAQEKNLDDLRNTIRLLEYKPASTMQKRKWWNPW